MWKEYLFLFLCLRTILSQPVLNEHIRDPRQLDFGECCPCTDSDKSLKDRNIFTSTVEERADDNNYACRSTQDSESASSIFRPALKIVKPLMRSSVIKEEPKRLLEPEVGLASSVLETLREVTDHEYQEALMRDATRSAIKDMESDTPRNNIVNIILKPKEKVDDTMPEASHIEETRCIHPPLSTPEDVNRLGQIRPQNKLFGEVFSLPKVAGNGLKNYFDMEKSASNLQEKVLPPLKNTILEDLKLKSNLLKMKLFPNLRNGLKNMQSDVNIMDPETKCNCHDNNKNINLPVSKLSLITDHVKTSNDNNFMTTPLHNMKHDNQQNDFDLKESNYIKNSVRSEYLPSSKMTKHKIPDDRNVHNSKLNKISKINEKSILIDNPEVEFVPFTEINLEENVVLDKDLIKNDCDFIINDDQRQLTGILSTDPGGTEILDVVPSTSEINEIKNTIDETENNIHVECNMDNCLSTENDILQIEDNQNQNQFDKILPGNDIFNDATKNNAEKANDILLDNIKNKDDEIKSCLINNLEIDCTDSNIQMANAQQNEGKVLNIDSSNKTRKFESEIRENQLITEEESLLVPTEKEFVEKIDLSRTKTINTLPNIKSDILKTLENFKMATEKIQDKLRLNMQNALQLSGMNNNRMKESESTTSNTSTDIKTEEINNDNDSINMQDLQEMSNRILNLSEISSHDSQDNQEQIDCTTDTSKEVENNGQEATVENVTLIPEKILELSESSIDFLKPLSKNSDELIDEVNSKKNKKQKINNNLIDRSSKSKLRDDSVSENDDLMETDLKTPNDHENEMMSEASNPYINRVPHIKLNQEAEPKLISNLNVKEFLENLKSSVSEILNSDTENLNVVYNDNDNSNSNSIFVKQHQQPYFEEQSLKLSEPKYTDLGKSYYKAQVRGEGFTSRKSNQNLNSYKAKIPSPDPLIMKEVPTETNANQRLLNDNTDIRKTSNILRSPLEIPNISSLKPLKNTVNDFDPWYNFKNSVIGQDTLSSTGSLKSISENLKSRTEEALKNIQDTFDATLKIPQLKNDNNIFSETLTKPFIFGTVTNANDEISNKLHAFNTDLRNRLSLVSQRIPPQNNISSKTKKINDLERKLKFEPKLNLQARNRDSLRNKHKNLSLKPDTSQLSSIRREGIAKPYSQQKSDRIWLRKNSDLFENLSKLAHPPKILDSKIPLRKDIKRKPLKESKVTLSFTNTSVPPKIIKPESISQKVTQKTTANFLSSINNLPKSSISLKTPLQRRLELKSKLKPDDPKPLASERYISHAVLPDRNFDKSPTSISEEKIDVTRMKEFSEEAYMTKNGNLFSDGLETLKGDKLEIPKLRNAINLKTLSDNHRNKPLFKNISNNVKSKTIGDILQSASNNNINTATTTIEKPLKENVSYKCKMVCFEDKIDST